MPSTIVCAADARSVCDS